MVIDLLNSWFLTFCLREWKTTSSVVHIFLVFLMTTNIGPELDVQEKKEIYSQQTQRKETGF